MKVNKSNISIGAVFGRLRVIKEAEKSKFCHRRYLCICTCGKEKIVEAGSLSYGYTTSCGCYHRQRCVQANTTHGHSNRTGCSKTYKAWRGMLARCLYPRDVNYHNYGARGITVCDRWKTFTNFLEDVGEIPIGLTLDRKDNNKEYSKSNCRLVPLSTQQRNKRTNKVITWQGQTKILIEWAEEFGVNYKGLSRKVIKFGVEIAFSNRDLRKKDP